jgi:hypothetical protein
MLFNGVFELAVKGSQLFVGLLGEQSRAGIFLVPAGRGGGFLLSDLAFLPGGGLAGAAGPEGRRVQPEDHLIKHLYLNLFSHFAKTFFGVNDPLLALRSTP